MKEKYFLISYKYRVNGTGGWQYKSETQREACIEQKDFDKKSFIKNTMMQKGYLEMEILKVEAMGRKDYYNYIS